MRVARFFVKIMSSELDLTEAAVQDNILKQVGFTENISEISESRCTLILLGFNLLIVMFKSLLMTHGSKHTLMSYEDMKQDFSVFSVAAFIWSFSPQLKQKMMNIDVTGVLSLQWKKNPDGRFFLKAPSTGNK